MNEVLIINAHQNMTVLAKTGSRELSLNKRNHFSREHDTRVSDTIMDQGCDVFEKA